MAGALSSRLLGTGPKSRHTGSARAGDADPLPLVVYRTENDSWSKSSVIVGRIFPQIFRGFSKTFRPYWACHRPLGSYTRLGKDQHRQTHPARKSGIGRLAARGAYRQPPSVGVLLALARQPTAAPNGGRRGFQPPRNLAPTNLENKVRPSEPTSLGR